jgi:hypothetical protein
MRIEFQVLHRACPLLARLAIALLVSASIAATGSNLQFVGDVNYTLSSNLAWVFADGYANYGPNGQSGPVRIELWDSNPINNHPICKETTRGIAQQKRSTLKSPIPLEVSEPETGW